MKHFAIVWRRFHLKIVNTMKHSLNFNEKYNLGVRSLRVNLEKCGNQPHPETEPPPYWLVQVKGEKCSGTWEISVVRSDNKLGQSSYGWFNERKLLVSHNGGHCSWPVIEFVWDAQVNLARDLCDALNKGDVELPPASQLSQQ